MLNQYVTTNPFIPSTLRPATPVLSDMLGATISYVSARPYQRLPLHAVGVVIGYRQYKGNLELKIKNTTTQRERWISENDFLAYVH